VIPLASPKHCGQRNLTFGYNMPGYRGRGRGKMVEAATEIDHQLPEKNDRDYTIA
jgi:hypothetical protein